MPTKGKTERAREKKTPFRFLRFLKKIFMTFRGISGRVQHSRTERIVRIRAQYERVAYSSDWQCGCMAMIEWSVHNSNGNRSVTDQTSKSISNVCVCCLRSETLHARRLNILGFILFFSWKTSQSQAANTTRLLGEFTGISPSPPPPPSPPLL